MEARLDKFGRVLIPKKLRGRMGLRPGSMLRVETADGVLVLRPERTGPLIVLERGLLVYSGEADGDFARAIADAREDRLSDLAGTGEDR